jgi:hypothetical protein
LRIDFGAELRINTFGDRLSASPSFTNPIVPLIYFRYTDLPVSTSPAIMQPTIWYQKRYDMETQLSLRRLSARKIEVFES